MEYPAEFAADQVVARTFLVFDGAARALVVVKVGVGAAQLGAVRLEAGRLHSERFLEAVLEVVAPAQGCRSLRNKGLCCRRGCSIQTPWVPIFRSRFISLVASSRDGRLLLGGRKEAIYGLRNFAHAAECVLPPMAAFPFFSPYSLLVKLLPP